MKKDNYEWLECFGRVLVSALLLTFTGENLMEESLIGYFIIIFGLVGWVLLSFKSDLIETQKQKINISDKIKVYEREE